MKRYGLGENRTPTHLHIYKYTKMTTYKNYYNHLKDYKEYVEREYYTALDTLCEAESNRDVIGLYAHTSNEAYQEWVIADTLAKNTKVVFNEWLEEKKSIYEEYSLFLDGLV